MRPATVLGLEASDRCAKRARRDRAHRRDGRVHPFIELLKQGADVIIGGAAR
jgi:hypothetical protein